ncbi:MAG TPA: alpha-1,4-glucan--maltose-1-phosphate maltosyltransferase [Acidisarcina sp.]
MRKPEDGRRRVVIESVKPEIDCGRFPVKRVVGDTVVVEADLFGDGHDHVSASLLFRRERDRNWQSLPMTAIGNDRWRGNFTVPEQGRYYYTVAGQVDHFGTWRADLAKRIVAGQDVTVDLKNGSLLIAAAAQLAKTRDRARLLEWARLLVEENAGADAKTLALDEGLAGLVARYQDKKLQSRHDKELVVTVDRERARFSAWYEFFPRSASPEAGVHGTFKDCEARLPYVVQMGFDVLYFPPIHPIGHAFRKGKNNAVSAEPDDVGSPWAIGSAEGGHTSIHPQLGTLADFRSLRDKAALLGLEIALDIAFQCAPDHPWVTKHPAWFKKRADGTIQYAENPPKKYQDIYPLDFESDEWDDLWDGLRDVFLYWAGEGIKIFRVDNPHTKAFPFWEWVIPEVKRRYPDVLFLAEAFTRPRVMQRLAKLGFTQSYTYFTWRNTKQELTEYFIELTTDDVKEYFGPNLWPNTPDILPELLQTGGKAAFEYRLVLAATLGASYGIYGAAFELGESAPFKPGGEEYLHSEKYELKHWDLAAPTSLSGLIAQINRIRRDNLALHSNVGLVFHATDNDSLICYSKSTEDGASIVLVIVNLDTVNVQSGWVSLNLTALHQAPDKTFTVEDLLTGATYSWQGPTNYVELSPEKMPAHIFRLTAATLDEASVDDGK